MTTVGVEGTGPGAGAGRPRGRPYDRSRDDEILALTLDALADSHDEHVTLDAVARRAGRAKTTLYRRWPTKVDLVLAAVHAAGRPRSTRPCPTGGPSVPTCWR